MWLNQASMSAKGHKNQTQKQFYDLYDLVDSLNNSDLEPSSLPPSKASSDRRNGRNSIASSIGIVRRVANNQKEGNNINQGNNCKRRSTAGSILFRLKNKKGANNEANSFEDSAIITDGVMISYQEKDSSFTSGFSLHRDEIRFEREQQQQQHQNIGGKKPSSRSLTSSASSIFKSAIKKTQVEDDYEESSISGGDNPEFFITLAVPNGNETTLNISDMYNQDEKKIFSDAFSGTIQLVINDLIEGSIEIPEELQVALQDELSHSRYRLTYKDYGKHILCSARNCARYFERCLERKELPHLFVHFSSSVIPDTET